MELWQVLILAVVEGITEFLPISSTGHLILTSKLLKLNNSEFLKTFEVFIQSGAILSVVVLYGRKLISDFELIRKILVSFIPTAILGFIFYSIVKQSLIGNELITLFALLIGGVVIILIEQRFKNRNLEKNVADLSYKKAFLIGIFQSLAMIPGVSRSASTILGGMILGLNRKTAVELSFILAIPTLIGATALDLYKNMDLINSINIQPLALGFLFSFLTALVVIKWFLKFIQTNNLIPFGIYRIILAILFFIFIF